ncbi:MAG: hypothetical protein N2043_11825 [Ignavibacterium sp.]|nr:hypothetical protein [Ignavibacterium sp.]
MLKELVFNLLNLNFEKLNFKNDYLSYKDIIDSNVHPAIKNYIQAETKILFQKDLYTLKKKSIFNYSSKKIYFLFDEIFKETIKSTFLNQEDIKNLFLQAISFNISHLIKPNWSLKKLIFNDKKNIGINDFYYFLDYAFFYPYQKKIIQNYFGKKDLISVDADDFEKLLQKIDQKLFSEYKKEIILDFINNSIEFLELVSNKFIPNEVVYSFLYDKSLNEEAKIFKDYISNKNDNVINEAELLELFSLNFSPDKELSSQMNDKNKSEFEESETEKIKSYENLKVNHKKIEDAITKQETLSLFDDIKESNEIEPEKEIKYSSPIIQTNLEKQKDKAVDQFLSLLSKKEISKIQENIFNYDYDDFINFIEKIISNENYESSLHSFEELIKYYNIDQSSKEMKVLKNAIKDFFGKK